MGSRTAVISILIIASLIGVSGCITTPGTNNTVSPLPTSAPTPTIAPSIVPGDTGHETIGSIHSTQVRIKDVKVAYARTKELQAENFTILFENVGDADAQNVGFNLKETDPQTGELYFTKVFLAGTIPANSTVQYNVTTATHDYVFSVILNIQVYWGEKVEYSNTYKNAFTLVFIPTD